MPLAIGYVLRGESDFAGENVLIAAARHRTSFARPRPANCWPRLRSGASGTAGRGDHKAVGFSRLHSITSSARASSAGGISAQSLCI